MHAPLGSQASALPSIAGPPPSIKDAEDERPPREHVAFALARWAEKKPDCVRQRDTLLSYLKRNYESDLQAHELFVGVTGGCLLDERGIIVTVEGSGFDHVSMTMCIRHRAHLQTGTLFLSRQPCPACLHRLAEVGAKKVFVRWYDSTASTFSSQCLMEPSAEKSSLDRLDQDLLARKFSLIPSAMYPTMEQVKFLLQHLANVHVEDKMLKDELQQHLSGIDCSAFANCSPSKSSPVSSTKNSPKSSPAASTKSSPQSSPAATPSPSPQQSPRSPRSSDKAIKEKVLTAAQEAFRKAQDKQREAEANYTKAVQFRDSLNTEEGLKAAVNKQKEENKQATKAKEANKTKKTQITQNNQTFYMLRDGLKKGTEQSHHLIYILSSCQVALLLIKIPEDSLPMTLLKRLESPGIKIDMKTWAFGVCFLAATRTHDALQKRNQDFSYIGCMIIEEIDAKWLVRAVAYNGTPAGIRDIHFKFAQPIIRSIHAEENALLHGQPCTNVANAHVYVSERPCNMCARSLLSVFSEKKIFFLGSQPRKQAASRIDDYYLADHFEDSNPASSDPARKLFDDIRKMTAEHKAPSNPQAKQLLPGEAVTVKDGFTSDSDGQADSEQDADSGDEQSGEQNGQSEKMELT